MAQVPPIRVPVTFVQTWQGPMGNDMIPCPDTGGWTAKLECPHLTIETSPAGVETRTRCGHRERTVEEYKKHWMNEHWTPNMRPGVDLNEYSSIRDPEPKFRRGDPDDQELTEMYLIGDEDDLPVHTEEFIHVMGAEMSRSASNSWPVVFRTPDMEEWVPHRVRTLRETRYTVIDLSLRET